eukprot:6986941-Prymnesium_polylepis.1
MRSCRRDLSQWLTAAGEEPAAESDDTIVEIIFAKLPSRIFAAEDGSGAEDSCGVVAAVRPEAPSRHSGQSPWLSHSDRANVSAQAAWNEWRHGSVTQA